MFLDEEYQAVLSAPEHPTHQFRTPPAGTDLSDIGTKSFPALKNIIRCADGHYLFSQFLKTTDAADVSLLRDFGAGYVSVPLHWIV